MEVILLERVAHLGQMGDVVRVKPGYARNYLLPQKKALRATSDNRQYFETQRVRLEAENLQRADEAKAIGGRLDGVSIVLIRAAGEGGQLYGSVSARDIAQGLEAQGFVIARSQVEIARPIKSLGLFGVGIVLHPEIAVTVTVNVARSAEEAEMQQAHGGMVTAEMVEAAIEAQEAAAAGLDAPGPDETDGEAGDSVGGGADLGIEDESSDRTDISTL